jgi:hypothetical protein
MSQQNNPVWICVVAGPVYNKSGGVGIIEQDVRNIFGQDFFDIEIVSSDDRNTEPHVFIKCRNYSDYINALIRSPSISIVLPSYDNPAYISESEVFSFRDSVHEQNCPVALRVGDKVCVSAGYLENLRGVVIEKCSKGFYDVLFRLHTRKFTEKIALEELVFEGNIFDKIRIPVSLSGVQGKMDLGSSLQTQPAYSEIVGDNKVHRSKPKIITAAEGFQCFCP